LALLDVGDSTLTVEVVDSDQALRRVRRPSASGRRVDREVIRFLPLMLETHCHLIGAGRGASLTYHVRVPSPAGVTGGIIILSIVQRCRDHRAITVDVDVG